MVSFTSRVCAGLVLARMALALNFTINNGQIYTPGFAIIDAPQPGTPLGGDTLQVALDVSADGTLPLPPYPSDSADQIFNITLFLYSYETGRNFTISNGTATANNASLGEIMLQEPGSTVKHINWVWPDCLVGNGQPQGSSSDRGIYNISIRQNFRVNKTDHYTILDLPIAVTNSIPESSSRPLCDLLNNPLLTADQIDAEAADSIGILLAPAGSTVLETYLNGTESGSGPSTAQPAPGAGQSAAAGLSWSWRAESAWVGVGGILLACLL